MYKQKAGSHSFIVADATSHARFSKRTFPTELRHLPKSDIVNFDIGKHFNLTFSVNPTITLYYTNCTLRQASWFEKEFHLRHCHKAITKVSFVSYRQQRHARYLSVTKYMDSGNGIKIPWNELKWRDSSYLACGKCKYKIPSGQTVSTCRIYAHTLEN